MNCSKCLLQFVDTDSSLKCRGLCGNHFHLSCLSSTNKAYKKALIKSLKDIPNLLWFCDACLPNSTNAFPSHSTDIPPRTQNHTNQSPVNSISFSPGIDDTHSQGQPDNSMTSVSSNHAELVQQNKSIQMAIDELTSNSTNNSMGNVENNASKRRRVSMNGDDNAVEIPIPTNPVAPRRTSTNYRCIYLSQYPPTMTESAVTQYAVSEKSRDATEIMECKRLLSTKCNMKKVTYVSFKLTVHAEFFDVYMDPTFWPSTVKAVEFETRPPKKRQLIPKMRVNPFAVQRPSRIQQKKNSPAQMPRTIPNFSVSHAPFCSNSSNHSHRNNNNNYRNVNSNPRPDVNQRSSMPNQKNHQRQFTQQTSRRFKQQNPRQNNNNMRQNRGQRTMEPAQLMALFEQLNWQLKSLLSQH